MAFKLIINADDLGFSKGINKAIKQAHQKGFLSHASIMVNTEFYEHAIENVVQQCENLNVGLHINLTCGKSLLNGKELRSSFIKLLFTPKTKRFTIEIEKEIELQIQELLKSGVNIKHIDGHEHVHIIPSINKVVRRLANKYEIPRIREINEDTIKSFNSNFKYTNFSNILKFILLKTLNAFNNNDKRIKFYSILNTCEVNEENLFKYLEQEEEGCIEIMLHPGIINEEEEYKVADRFKKFLKSEYRNQEYKLCFNSKFKNYEIDK